MKKDLTGQRFGRLTALEPVRSDPRQGVIWHCRCDCGGEKEVPTAYLMRGQTQSCGCLTREHNRRQDITGQRFGRLTAIEFCHYNEKHQDCWRFQCDCGEEVVIPSANVKWGNTRSCGCLEVERIRNMHREDLTGQRFGYLVALQPTDKRDAGGSIVWECACDCGNHTYYSVSRLRQGSAQSCGCLSRESRTNSYNSRKDAVEDTNISSLIGSKRPRKNNTSGCTGVCQEKQRGMWLAYIDFQKKRYFLGAFADREQAIEERKKAEQRLHDPYIRDKLALTTNASKEKFLAYLSGSE